LILTAVSFVHLVRVRCACADPCMRRESAKAWVPGVQLLRPKLLPIQGKKLNSCFSAGKSDRLYLETAIRAGPVIQSAALLLLLLWPSIAGSKPPQLPSELRSYLVPLFSHFNFRCRALQHSTTLYSAIILVNRFVRGKSY